MKLFKKPIFVSISPNAEWDDVFLALRLLVTPWTWIKGGATKQFAEEVKKYLGVDFAFLFDSGRTSLYAILKAMDVKNGDEVLVQAFTCTAAVNPILWLGASPVYVDLEEGTYNMSPEDLSRKISNKSKAVIIQHTFGLPGPCDRIMETARKNKLMVIEDVAHALGSEYKGKKAGTMGDAALLSFGRFKIISSVFGGAAVTSNEALGKKIEEAYKDYPYPSRFWIFEQVFHPVFLSIAKPLYNIFDIGKVMVVLARRLKVISPAVYAEEKVGGKPGFGPSRMPNSLAVLGIRQIKKIARFNEHRVRLSEIYQKLFAAAREIGLPRIAENSNPVFLNFPILFADANTASDVIRRSRKREGIYIENWPAKKVIGPQGTNLEKLRYQPGSCPVAEKTALNVVTLPTNPNTTEGDAERVASVVASFLKNK